MLRVHQRGVFGRVAKERGVEHLDVAAGSAQLLHNLGLATNDGSTPAAISS